MSPRLRAILGGLREQVPTVLVLAGLGVLAAWGAANDWKLDRLANAARRARWRGQEAGKPEKKEEEPTAPGISVVELDGNYTAARAGIKVAPVEERDDWVESVRANGQLAFDQTHYAHLATRVAGSAWRVYRNVGDPVAKGDVLALVSAAEVGKVKADLLQALVQVDIKAKLLARLESAGSSIPERQLRAAESALREARLNLLTAQQALANYGLPIRLDDLRQRSDAEVARRLRLLGLPRKLTAELNGDVLSANLLPIRAPFEGMVIRRDVVAGEMVSPSRPQFVLADVRRVWAMLDVRLEDVGRLKVGQKVTFEADTAGQTAKGKLKWISAEVDRKTRTVRARAEFDNPDGRLRPATFGTAKIEIRRGKALVVPAQAVQWSGGSYRVFVRLDEKEFQPRLVLPGTRANGYVELLDPGTLLATGALGGLLSPDGYGALRVAAGLKVGATVLAGVRRGESVVTTGSHALNAEVQKDRIAGEE
jgi:cobalt-zinc-cadmium efflux system membrane fusion protein